VNSFFTQNVIAIIWDFDKTLIPDYMQGPIFEEFGIDEANFWKEANGLHRYYRQRDIEVAPDTAYLNHFLTYVREDKFKGRLTNAALKALGGRLKFYPGMPDFLRQIKEIATEKPEYRQHGISVEEYIVSSGLRQIILGSEAAKYVDGVWGCEFIEDPAPAGYSDNSKSDQRNSSQISQIGYVIDNTTKTRAIFEINKGSNKHPINVNDTMASEDRRVPFQNMIYVADGPSDVPVFSVLNQYGGRTFAVYNPQREEQFIQVNDLQRQRRINSYGPANYEKGTQAYLWLVHSVREIANEIVTNRNSLLERKLGKSPVHLVEEPAITQQVPVNAADAKEEPPPSVSTVDRTSKAAESSGEFSMAEFKEILRTVALDLTEEELGSSYQALLKCGGETAPIEQIRARAKRFASQLSDSPRTEDLFLGGSEGAPERRLPRNPRDWEKI